MSSDDPNRNDEDKRRDPLSMSIDSSVADSRSRYVLNPSARDSFSSGLFVDEDYTNVARFFRSLPGYAPTPLRSLPNLASDLGIGELLVKDESFRFRLPAFKILGVSYAIHCLFENGSLQKNSILVCATDGNHGRAVAHVARQHGLTARVYIHKDATHARVQAIAAEGAEVVIVDGNYDDSVRVAADAAETHHWKLISDTAWPTYAIVPRYIMAGYTMLMAELAEQWTEVADIVLVQAGVGGLACAVVSWLLNKYSTGRPFTVCCEPEAAACVFESLRAGEPRIISGSLDTAMAGLSCGTISSLAWPTLKSGLDACVIVSDIACFQAMRRLAYPSGADAQIVAGESGACGMAALALILSEDALQPLRHYLQVNAESRVLIVNTEGATDAETYSRITGLRPE